MSDKIIIRKVTFKLNNEKLQVENDGKKVNRKVTVYALNLEQIFAYAEEVVSFLEDGANLFNADKLIKKILPECSDLKADEVMKLYPDEIESLFIPKFKEVNTNFLSILERAGFTKRMKTLFSKGLDLELEKVELGENQLKDPQSQDKESDSLKNVENNGKESSLENQA